MTAPNREIVQRWVAALRSGEYPQTTGKLQIKDHPVPEKNGFCCLGVLCEIAVADDVIVSKDQALKWYPSTGDVNATVAYHVTYYRPRNVRWGHVVDVTSGIRLESSTELPAAVAAWAGFNVAQPHVLIDGEMVLLPVVNDSLKKTFNEIADLIEATYLRVREPASATP